MVTRLLVANRGEIACRVLRTAAAMGLTTVAVYSAADRRALHVEEADEAILLGGLTPAESYLRVEALIEAARRTGADALHPGYGFLAENADFARACNDAGIAFVGPSPEAIAAMGDKLRAKALMREAGVPVLEVFDPAAVPEDAYPVLVKAVAGGGGKGMRIVTAPADLDAAVAAARRESAAAFGDEAVFVEPYLARPRHVEVQIVGDVHGTVVHLGERECSIQRRHQKVIEESPSPAVDEGLRKELGDAAVAAGRALGYTNAGTVEFILAPDGAFYFLEVNTRLQVEHPVTELAWRVGAEPLDLVRLQLLVARGEPLPFAQSDLRRSAHAIEARLYAEDPAADFLPAAGTLDVFDPAGGVRWDAGVRAGDEVSVHYDPLLAKAIASGADRHEAAGRLAAALERSRIHGVTTNRDFLVAALRHEAFLDGRLHTAFIDEHLPPAARAPATEPQVVFLHAAAAALAAARARRREQAVLATLPPGWRNNPSQPQHVSFRAGDLDVEVGYRAERDGSWHLTAGGLVTEARVLGWPDERADGALDLEIDGRRLRVHVCRRGAVAYADSPLGHTTLVEQARFPDPYAEEVAGGLVAPMPGTVTRVDVAAGDAVTRGTLLILLEAMKMEHRITAPHDGTVTDVRVAPGAVVAADDVLVVVEHGPGHAG